MANTGDILDEVIEVAHPFEAELDLLVVMNHQLVIEAIASYQDKQVDQIQEKFAAEDHDLIESLARRQEWISHDLRVAANHLALVGLVTRLQHWILVLVNDNHIDIDNKAGLVGCVSALNREVGDSPVSIAYLSELVTARDSVVHGDSKAQWTHVHKKVRKVSTRYCSGSQLQMSEEHLNEAIAKAVELVKWYDERLAQRSKTPAA